MNTKSFRWALRLRGYSRALAAVPSLVFGLTYLLSIPLFAVIYAAAPNDFYSATARYEYVRSDDARLILTDIRSAIVSNFETAYDSISKRHGSWDVNITAFSVDWPSVVPEDLHLVIHGSAYATRTGYPRIFSFPIDLSGIPLGPRQTGPQHETYTDITRESPIEGLDPSFLFPCLNQEADTCLRIPWGPASNRLERARQTLQGLPNPYLYWTPRRFLRMLYFSAVTISTLGYGDIVPISTLARTMVTLEVILGPVLLGLFLNSLITEASRELPPRMDDARQSTDTI